MTPDPVADAVSALWTQPPPLNALSKAPAFQALLTAYRSAYPASGSRQTTEFALRDAVRRLGLGADAGINAAEAAARLHRAALATTSQQLHLCPLDWAGEIPFLAFGPNTVRTFQPEELGRLIQDAAASPVHALEGLDLRALAQFRWLVVRETVPIAADPGARALPSLWINMRSDFGRIEPHRRRLPHAVERALFCLLALPWEDLTRESSSDWRPFQIPWAYTVNDDLFTRPAAPPDPASLTWDTRYYDLGNGDFDEVEIPLEIRLDDEGEAGAMRSLDDPSWRLFEAAEASPLLTAPILHFFLAGLMADGIDEFLAHVTTIEACLGLATDHGRHPPLPDKSNGATARTAWRLGALLGDPQAGAAFKAIFKLRSRYIHGESMPAISSTDRTTARRLARRCVCALVSAAASQPAPSDRAAWLGGLIPAPA